MMSTVYKRESRQLKGWMINPTETSMRTSEIFKIASWQPVGGLGATQCYFYKVRLELKKRSFHIQKSRFLAFLEKSTRFGNTWQQWGRVRHWLSNIQESPLKKAGSRRPLSLQTLSENKGRVFRISDFWTQEGRQRVKLSTL